MKIFGDQRSGNCLKVKYTADRLGLSYEWVAVDIMTGGSRTAEFLAMNPAGQVPAVEFDDGRVLAQSNAIILYLAEGTDLIPEDAFERARVMELLFWEQYSHEPSIAVRRFRKVYQGLGDADIEPHLMERGEAALEFMEGRLGGDVGEDGFLVGPKLTVADISLVAYTRLAGEGGFDLGKYPRVTAWVERVEAELGIGES